MRRLLAIGVLAFLPACSAAPSATTASGLDDHSLAPATPSPTTTTQGATTTNAQPAVASAITTAAPTTPPPSTATTKTTTTSTTTTSTATTSTVTTSTMVVSTTTTEAGVEVVEVGIENFRFVPVGVTVRVGDTVRWTVRSGTHTTTADGAVWSSPGLALGESFSWVMDAPGTFGYFCAIHPGMRGTITVEG